ncbi:MAG TPA: carbohydrate binding domain-containing protein [Planctomycetota bacterium]|nr:carbohydrate binding domain-containing protein [Planctomycetota bacterium]HRR79943.1 carbohydrate binding domain-containing protein [Planctomycetota bacterium]HRT95366.1 carbohydrate binding domain-containing protein [Planctomycetota bacterium]
MRIAELAALLVGLGAAQAVAAGIVYPQRWVYVSRGLHQDSDVAEIRDIVRTASEHGLNGMVLATGWDRLDLQPPHFFARVEQVKAMCQQHKIEIIPILFSAGYGGSVLAHDKSLAAGIPVRDALFVAKGGEARLVPDPPVEVANGGFEDFKGNQLKGFRFHDKPGEVSFVDTAVAHGGKASLRFETSGADKHGHARVMQEVAVKPHRCYRVSVWVKTDGLEPKGAFRVQVLTEKSRALAPFEPQVPATSDWREVVLGFNSLEYDRVRIYLGAWGGRSGKFWVDDLTVEEVGLINVLRRPGTPVVVKGEASGTVYEEGKDFAPIADPKLNFRFDHVGPAIKLLPGTRIAEGERLRVSYYHGIAINQGQVSVCMSEPKLYEIWREQVRLVQKHLAPAKWLLSMDEVRAGGSCEACKGRKMTMGEILGDCITRQFQMIREANPKAEVYCWSDMLDPNHNAHGDYYLVEGDFAGSWQHVPKDLIIVCWYYEKREPSLAHFSKLGFKTLAGAYYDADTLDNPRGWLEALDKTPSALGIMYTTWQNKYQLLGPFGELASKR